MKKYCFGVDVGGTTVKVGLFTVEGQLLDKWEIITRTENNGENILFDICESLEAKLDEKSIDLDEVKGIGIGLPGPDFAICFSSIIRTLPNFSSKKSNNGSLIS